MSINSEEVHRTSQQIEDLRKRSKNAVDFLPRRTYENYLISPEAVSAIIAESCGEIVSPDNISAWLEANGGDSKFEAAKEWTDDKKGAGWLTRVHGAEFLRDLFSDVTESKLSYDKVIHSVKLTEWLLRHNPDHLKGLVEYVSGLVGLSKAP